MYMGKLVVFVDILNSKWISSNVIFYSQINLSLVKAKHCYQRLVKLHKHREGTHLI